MIINFGEINEKKKKLCTFHWSYRKAWKQIPNGNSHSHRYISDPDSYNFPFSVANFR